jgi:hypothetical protein
MNKNVHLGVRFDTALYDEFVGVVRGYDQSVGRLVREAAADFPSCLAEVLATLRTGHAQSYIDAKHRLPPYHPSVNLV